MKQAERQNYSEESSWIEALVRHYHRIRKRYPNDKLLVVFDIDGTILDLRHMVLHVLQSYDEFHGTRYFSETSVCDILGFEDSIYRLLRKLELPSEKTAEVTQWYMTHRWNSSTIRKSHHSYQGILEVIRWFQIQPLTYVGLNTSRPESLRRETLRVLNELGSDYRVSFSNRLLRMNPHGWQLQVQESKTAGLRYFEQAGYRIVAVIDNEVGNLSVVQSAGLVSDVLLLDANSIFVDQRIKFTNELGRLVESGASPRPVQFIWKGVHNTEALDAFLKSGVRWAEVDVRCDSESGVLWAYDESSCPPDSELSESAVPLAFLIKECARHSKGIKINIHKQLGVVKHLIPLLKRARFAESKLCFDLDCSLHARGVAWQLQLMFPMATIQCAIDHLSESLRQGSVAIKSQLERLSGAGVRRFSIHWANPYRAQLIDVLEDWGFESALSGIPDLESFFQAVLLLPSAVSFDFSPIDASDTASISFGKS